MRGDSVCLIGLDLGTSAIKGVLVDAHGHVLAKADVPTPPRHPHDGWVETDPEEWCAAVCGTIIRQLAANARGEITALAMAAASGNTLLTTDDGKPLTQIISWMDQRAANDQLPALTGFTTGEVTRVTGWPCLTSFPLAHLAWLLEHKPEIYRSAGHYAMDTDWLLYRLTGQWRMDHSTATTFHLQEQTTGTYYEPFLRSLEIPEEKLSKLICVGEHFNVLPVAGCGIDSREGVEALPYDILSSRTLVVSGCFDHPAAARAVGVVNPGDLLLSCGTSWVGLTPCMDRQALLDAGCICDPYLSRRGGPWAGMFSVPGIGRTIEWYIDHLIAPGEADRLRVFNEAAAEASPGAGGLCIDLRQPPHAVNADRAQISRAVMEGAARLMHEKLLELAAHGFGFTHAVMVGGPAGSPVWPSIVADTTGLVISARDRAAGARGAAMLAGIGVGLYRDEEAALEVWARGVAGCE